MTSVTRGSFINFAAQIVANAGFFAAVVMIARALGPDGRGTIAFVIVSALVLARASGLGIDNATLVFASSRPPLRPQLLANFLLFGVSAGAIVAAAGIVAMVLLGDSNPAGVGVAEILVVVIGTVAVALTAASDAFLLGSGRIGQRAAVLAIVPWVYAGLIGVMLFTGTITVTRSVAAWAVAMVGGAGALIWLAFRVGGLMRPSMPLLRESIAFGARAWVGGVASFLNMRLDQILLGVIATQAALGVYAIAVNGAEILLYFPAAVAATLVPALARAEPDARHLQALRTFRILGATTLASVVVAAIVGPRLLPAVFGDRFQESVVPFLWLLPGALGYATKTVFSSALIASSSPLRSSVGSLAALGTGVTLDLVLIPVYGATGAAAAASAAFVVAGIVSLVLYRGRHPFSWKSIVPRVTDFAALRQLNPYRSRAASSRIAVPTDLPLRGAGIVCISSIDWDFVWQAHQEIMSRLAAGGNRVVFIENSGGVRTIRASDAGRVLRRIRRLLSQVLRGDRKPLANLTVVAPLILPFPRSQLARRLNENVFLPRLATKIRGMVGPDPVIYSFLPTKNALQVIDLLRGPLSPVVYHCLADHKAVSDDPADAVATERAIVERSDLIFSQNMQLAASFVPRAKVHIFSFAVDTTTFDPASASSTSLELATLPRPVLGYIGALHRHVDVDLLRELARAFPGGSLVLVGPPLVDVSELRAEPNVYFLGRRPHAELPSLVSGFDVGLIPYKRNAYTETVNPAKLFEYLAMGTPVVSTDLPEVVALQLPSFALRTARDRSSFVGAVKAALQDGTTCRDRRRELALDQDWGATVEKIAALLADLRKGADRRVAS